MISLELQQKIAVWRERAVAGTLTEPEMKEAILALREDRLRASQASDASRRKKAIVAIPAAEDLLGEMENL